MEQWQGTQGVWKGVSKGTAVGNGAQEALGTPACVGNCKVFGFCLREMGNHDWVFRCDLVYILPGFTLAAVLKVNSRVGEQESRD